VKSQPQLLASGAVALQRSAETGPTLVVGKIVAERGPDAFEIEIDRDVVVARAAYSCLVRPVAADRVLVSAGPQGAFILAVLERLISDEASLALPQGGTLKIEADSLKLAARRELAVDAPSVNLRGGRVTIFSETLTLIGKVASWIAGQMRISADTQETVADIISTRAVERSANVANADVLQAGTLVQKVDSLAATTADTAVIATKEDLRFDGKRVSVG
jgi:hypothetical protein